MKVYGVPLSVHVRKVLLAARLKGIACEVVPVVPVAPPTLPENWREISPTGLVPAIEDDGFRVADSTAILRYLERKQPEPRLIPEGAREEATALFLESWAGSALFQGVIRPIFHNQVVNPNIRGVAPDLAVIETAVTVAAPEALGYLESLQPEHFLVGDRLSVADLAVVSNLVMFHYLGQTLGGRFPRLQAYFDRHLADPVIRGVIDDERPFVDRMGLERGFLSA